MNKLEQQLIYLGYVRNDIQKPYIWEKDFNNFILKISIEEGIKGWVNVGLYSSFRRQSQIDDLQQEFNELQKDLEILKENEKNERR